MSKRSSRSKVRVVPVQRGATARNSETWRWIPPLAVVCAGTAAYYDILLTPFIFDDRYIVENPRLHSLWSPWAIVTGTSRPLADLSLAINYAIDSVNPVGYHAFNLVVHLVAALALFGLARRTLLTAALRYRYAAVAPWLALAVALVWLVHPLQTESVTYTVQRSESLMGLFYLLTLYCVVRGPVSARPARWYAAAVAACALGMASKPVMVTAPVLVLLYDRVFLAGSWQDAWRQRRWMYVGLAATWAIPALLLSGPHESAATTGFSLGGLTAFEYARTQPGVILHYLTLVFWPRRLVLDYAWPVARNADAILWPALVIAGFGALAIWALRRRPALGFLGFAFFLILAPTSSVVPIADLAFEHRMYLPLAAVVTLVLVGGDALLRRVAPTASRRHMLATGMTVALVAILGLLTIRRNQDYSSPIIMWTDVVDQRPANPRAHSNLGEALFRTGMVEQAVAHYVQALRLAPDYADAHNNLGVALVKQGRDDAAIEHYREALRLKPDYAEAHSNLGNALSARGQYREAVAQFHDALRINPDNAEVHSNLGLALAAEGKHDEAIEQYTEALRLKSDLAEAHHNMGNSLFEQGRLERAVDEYRTALRLNPSLTQSSHNLALALEELAKNVNH